MLVGRHVQPCSNVATSQGRRFERHIAGPIKPASSRCGLTGEAQKGHNLFDHNCAHCHGDVARGEEGPNLYNLRKSDARITAIVKGGIKGEMPSFAKKFKDADIQALIAYLRTLKE